MQDIGSLVQILQLIKLTQSDQKVSPLRHRVMLFCTTVSYPCLQLHTWCAHSVLGSVAAHSAWCAHSSPSCTPAHCTGSISHANCHTHPCCTQCQIFPQGVSPHTHTPQCQNCTHCPPLWSGSFYQSSLGKG